MRHDDSFTDESFDEYAVYEAQFDPLYTERKARRQRKPRARHEQKDRHRQAIDALADPESLEGGFNTTYQPSKYEGGWLLQSLRPFYDQGLITDVLALVKGGKEASVYRCAADASLGVEFVAAKVYRPRMFRQLRNDSLYRQGRAYLTADGRPVKKTDHRIMRAIGKKTDFGMQVAHTSWLMHEFAAMQRLHAAGANVPVPYATGPNAVLMSYVGDATLPAPMLSEVKLEQEEAGPLFALVLRNLHLLLAAGFVHGDLSAYNLLYWAGSLTLIDFPQITDLDSNPNAARILWRDVRRICEYFAPYHVCVDADAIAASLWTRYAGPAAQAAPEELFPLEDDLDDAR
ncbi:MAG: hypothetical protein JW910_07770 [Anaerolineae bacterium]|nr:hypothetical protein [Anaerolineae bacterium]